MEGRKWVEWGLAINLKMPFENRFYTQEKWCSYYVLIPNESECVIRRVQGFSGRGCLVFLDFIRIFFFCSPGTSCHIPKNCDGRPTKFLNERWWQAKLLLLHECTKTSLTSLGSAHLVDSKAVIKILGGGGGRGDWKKTKENMKLNQRYNFDSKDSD